MADIAKSGWKLLDMFGNVWQCLEIAGNGDDMDDDHVDDCDDDDDGASNLMASGQFWLCLVCAVHCSVI